MAYSKDITFFLKAWEVSDTSQTHRAEETYTWLKQNRDTAQFNQLLTNLYAYVDQHPDERLLARIILFDVFGHIELGMWQGDKFSKGTPRLVECMKLVNRLEDDQFLAELYTLCAEVMEGKGNYILYNLKAIELQQKVGTSHFVYVANRYCNVSAGLYFNEDYEESIKYGLKFFTFSDDEKKGIDPKLYIIQLDLIGASYFHLGDLGKSKFYYEKLLDTLQKKPNPDENYQKLWLSIAKGNIGRVLAYEDKLDEALLLINEHLEISLAQDYYNNVAMAQNNLGYVYFRKGEFKKSLLSYQQAYRYAIKSDLLKEKITACKGLVVAFRQVNLPDSAFKYAALQQTYRDSLVENIHAGKLSTIKANIDFDNMQENLTHANEVIRTQRLTRNFILVSIVFLTVITLLLYNRKMLQQKHHSELLERKQKLAEEEANRAKDEILSFTENIIEKENLIQNLQKQLKTGIESINQSLLNYTLVTDSEWDKFRTEFYKAYPDFLNTLHKKLPNSTPAEERLSALLFLKLSSNQIANTLGISKDSVGRSKRRLKHRLNLPVEVSLEDYLSQEF